MGGKTGGKRGSVKGVAGTRRMGIRCIYEEDEFVSANFEVPAHFLPFYSSPKLAFQILQPYLNKVTSFARQFLREIVRRYIV